MMQPTGYLARAPYFYRHVTDSYLHLFVTVNVCYTDFSDMGVRQH